MWSRNSCQRSFFTDWNGLLDGDMLYGLHDYLLTTQTLVASVFGVNLRHDLRHIQQKISECHTWSLSSRSHVNTSHYFWLRSSAGFKPSPGEMPVSNSCCPLDMEFKSLHTNVENQTSQLQSWTEIWTWGFIQAEPCCMLISAFITSDPLTLWRHFTNPAI